MTTDEFRAIHHFRGAIARLEKEIEAAVALGEGSDWQDQMLAASRLTVWTMHTAAIIRDFLSALKPSSPTRTRALATLARGIDAAERFEDSWGRRFVDARDFNPHRWNGKDWDSAHVAVLAWARSVWQSAAHPKRVPPLNVDSTEKIILRELDRAGRRAYTDAVAEESGRVSNRRREAPPAPGRKASVNARMMEEIQRNPEEAMGWTSTQWAKRLKCARSSVVDTATWDNLKMARERNRAERARDRRRRPKASDRRRD
jgi:hypothetical protein